MTIATLIATEVVKKALKKNAIRVAQRKVGVKKAASIYRRYNSKKTFIENFKKDPKKKLTQIAKSFAKRKLFSTLPPVKYLHN